MNKIAVYGSLRVGEYNNRGIGKHLGTEKISGFSLKSYPRAPYPYVVRDENSTIVVDLFEIDDNTKHWIDRMEVGAGYSIQQVEIKGEMYTIYVLKEELEGLITISTGDWSKRQEEEQYVQVEY